MPAADLLLLAFAAIAVLTGGVIGWVWAGTLYQPDANPNPPPEDEPSGPIVWLPDRGHLWDDAMTRLLDAESTKETVR